MWDIQIFGRTVFTLPSGPQVIVARPCIFFDASVKGCYASVVSIVLRSINRCWHSHSLCVCGHDLHARAVGDLEPLVHAMLVSTTATHERPCEANENQVLQFLLGEAPLSSSMADLKAGARVRTTGRLHAPRVAGDDGDGEKEGEENGDLLDAPVLEYASDIESEDDYIDTECVAQVERSHGSLSTKCIMGWSENAVSKAVRVNEFAAAEQTQPAALPTLEDDPSEADACEVETTAGVQEPTLESFITAASDTKPVDSHSDTASNCTDSDGDASDEGAGADSFLSNEVEEEPTEQPESAADNTFNAIKLKNQAPDLSVASSSDSTLPSTHRTISTERDRETKNADNHDDHPDKARLESRDQSEGASDNAQPEQQDFTEPQQEASTTEDDGSDEPQQQESSPEGSPKKPKKNHAVLAPTVFEIAFVGLVALGVTLYVMATIYAFFHPIFLPLPTLEILQTPLNFSNVSVVITGPMNGSLIEQPLYFEWQLVDYPIAAISKYGPEVFEYRVFVNEKRVVSEIGLLNTSISLSGAAAEDVNHMLGSEEPGTFNTTIRHRIAAHHLPDFAKYELKVEVTLPIPGSDGAVHKVQERVYITKAFDVSRTLEVLSPQDGSTFAAGEAVVLEYRASNVKKLEMLIDGLWTIEKQHIGDGNLLLRGLGVGQHTIELLGLDSSGRRILGRDGRLQTTTIQVLD